jgi:hypothetical protein
MEQREDMDDDNLGIGSLQKPGRIYARLEVKRKLGLS